MHLIAVFPCTDTEILVSVIDVETGVKGTKRKLATKAAPPSSNKKQKPNARELLHVPLNVKVIGSDSWQKAVITEVEGDLVDFHYESGDTRCGVRLSGDTGAALLRAVCSRLCNAFYLSAGPLSM